MARIDHRLHGGIFKRHRGSLLGNFGAGQERSEFLSKMCTGRADDVSEVM